MLAVKMEVMPGLQLHVCLGNQYTRHHVGPHRCCARACCLAEASSKHVK